MTSLFVAWVVYPSVVGLLAVGLGTVVERGSGLNFGLAGRLVTGFAAFVAFAGFARVGPTAATFVEVVLVLATLVGLGLAVRERPRGRPAAAELAPLLGGLVAWAMAAAPFLLSGRAAFGGYRSLGDSGFQMVGAELLPRIGATTHGLERSAITRVMDQYFADGYPSGALTAVGIPSSWLGISPVWTYQPFLAMLLGVAGVAAALLVRESRMGGGWWLAPVALVAGAAPLTAAFAMQGSIKEMSGAALFLVVAATAACAWPQMTAGRLRTAAPVGIAAAAVVGVLGPGAGPLLLAFAGILGVVLAVLTLRGSVRVGAWLTALVAVGVAVVVGIPAITAALSVVDVATSVLTVNTELGNLPGELPWWKPLAGWFAYDYRYDGQVLDAPMKIITPTVTLVLGSAALVAAVRHRAWVFLAAVAASAIACWYIVTVGSPWAAGKAMSMGSIVFWTAAAAFGSFLAISGRRRAGGLVLLSLVAVVAGTGLFAYRGVFLSPETRLSELAGFADRIEDGRPILIAEFDEHVKTQFVDDRPATLGEGAFLEWRVRTVGGDFPGDAQNPPVDQLEPKDLDPYGWVVARRGPDASWPPPSFTLDRSTQHYHLFRRTSARVPTVWRPVRTVDGGATRPVPCRRVRAMGKDGFALVRPTATKVVLTQHPRYWVPDPSRPWLLDMRGAGFVDQPIDLPVSGRYTIWAEGTFNRDMRLRVDGRPVGGIAAGSTNVLPQLEPATGSGGVQLEAGYRVLRIQRASGGMAPGTARNAAGAPAGASPALIGRVAVEPAVSPRLVRATDIPCTDGRVSVDWYGRW